MNIEELYRTYFDIVYRYIRSISQDGALAEEVTQETFFKALEKIDQFRVTVMCVCGSARSQKYVVRSSEKTEEATSRR